MPAPQPTPLQAFLAEGYDNSLGREAVKAADYTLQAAVKTISGEQVAVPIDNNYGILDPIPQTRGNAAKSAAHVANVLLVCWDHRNNVKDATDFLDTIKAAVKLTHFLSPDISTKKNDPGYGIEQAKKDLQRCNFFLDLQKTNPKNYKELADLSLHVIPSIKKGIDQVQPAPIKQR
jgi:hypothetical protein